MGGRLYVLIPCERSEAFSNGQTLNRFHELLEQAETVETLKHSKPSESAFLDAGRRVVELSEIIIPVWDDLEAKGKGGTGDIVRYAPGVALKLL